MDVIKTSKGYTHICEHNLDNYKFTNHQTTLELSGSITIVSQTKQDNST